jgi:pimeloyl-ACP methyl ester carboxylesterase
MTGLAIVLTGVVGCAAQGSDASTAGRRFNLPLRTLGGAQLWADVAWSDGWRVQRHVWTRHHRVLDDSNVRRGWGDEAHCRGLLEENADRSGTGHAVVLLHGLGRTRYSLGPLRRGLEEQGYQVVSLSYPSTRASLDEHAASVARVLDGMHGVERVSFVTHSLGGRVVLRVLERDDAWRERIELGRVVQLAPPNQGSRFAAKTRRVPPVGWVLGPSLLELADGNSSPALNDVEVGVISGARGKPYGWNPLLLEDDDGVVGLSETCPQFPHEHKTVRGFHTVLMNDAEVIGATSRFLAQGTFEAR